MQVKIVPANAKMPDHFAIIEQVKKQPLQKVVVTPVSDNDVEEPALPDDTVDEV